LPFDIRLGGYKEVAKYPFTSRGLHPYQRSLSIQGNRVVAVGWPYVNGKFARNLDKLRRSFNSANILHKYHRAPDVQDNDFYFVLGRVKSHTFGAAQLQSSQE
jgi:hypothetical protein